MSKYYATKVFFVAFVLFNICSSFFHLYSSKEISSKYEIHSKGDVIIYAEKDVENSRLSKDSINVIHIEGDVIIYDSLKKEGIDEQPKIVRTTKKETVVKVHKTSIKKTYKKNKVNTSFTNCNSDFLVTSLLLEYNTSVVPQNTNYKYAINNEVNTKNVKQVYKEQKTKNYYFSKEITNSFSKKYFGRPPPFLI